MGMTAPSLAGLTQKDAFFQSNQNGNVVGFKKGKSTVFSTITGIPDPRGIAAQYRSSTTGTTSRNARARGEDRAARRIAGEHADEILLPHSKTFTARCGRRSHRWRRSRPRRLRIWCASRASPQARRCSTSAPEPASSPSRRRARALALVQSTSHRSQWQKQRIDALPASRASTSSKAMRSGLPYPDASFDVVASRSGRYVRAAAGTRDRRNAARAQAVRPGRLSTWPPDRLVGQTFVLLGRNCCRCRRAHNHPSRGATKRSSRSVWQAASRVQPSSAAS